MIPPTGAVGYILDHCSTNWHGMSEGLGSKNRDLRLWPSRVSTFKWYRSRRLISDKHIRKSYERDSLALK